MTFQSAVAEYKAGKYQSALSMFKTFNASSPNNPLVHYYIGLCQHRLGHIDQAKQEYQFVVTAGDVKLRPMAQQALIQLSGTHASGGGFVSQSQAGSATSPSQTSSSRKAKKVIEFYADWWGPCKRFAPVFDATKNSNKFRDVSFQQINLDSHDPLAEQYQIRSIPRVVILSGGNDVLYNGRVPMEQSGFEELINQYRWGPIDD